VSVVGAVATPTQASASPITVSYGKSAIRRYINRNYTVALGPYFGACQKLASNIVRCEVQFKAGLYWRCGRVSVRNSGRYDYISARLPIGC
jgi:hypothetical protein